MKVLVIGGTGFVGSHVVKELLDRGHTPVVFDLRPARSSLDEVVGPAAADLPIIAGDVTQLYQLLHAIQAHQITDVVHLAAALNHVCIPEPPVGVQVNVGGMVNVLEACRLTGIRRLVWASSAAVFGGYPPEEVARDDSPHRPINLYASTKSFAERLAQHYFNQFGTDSIAIRYTFMSGPGMQRGVNTRLLGELVTKPALGEPGLVPWGDDSANWLWVGDAARATVLALEAATPTKRAYNISSEYRSIAEVADLVRRLIPGAQLTLEPGALGLAHRLDGSAAVADFGYRYAWDVERQMRFLIDVARGRAER